MNHFFSPKLGSFWRFLFWHNANPRTIFGIMPTVEHLKILDSSRCDFSDHGDDS